MIYSVFQVALNVTSTADGNETFFFRVFLAAALSKRWHKWW